MIQKIVHSSVPITLVGGADATVQEVQDLLTIAPKTVAVDGGLTLALTAGADPEAVIGDMDSVAPETLARVSAQRCHRINEQQSTDFDKALRHISAPVVLAAGFHGGRVDHQLAVYHVLRRRAEQPCVVLAGQQIILLAPPRLNVPTEAGDIVSLFPLEEVSGRSTGLEWPIDGLSFHPAAFIGTSNRATGPITLEMDGPGMLLILPKRLIQQVAAALCCADCARWPSPTAQYKSRQPS